MNSGYPNLSKLRIIYTNIGRGHPYYLDGIIEVMNRQGQISLVHSETDVFELSSGLSLWCWRLVEWLYKNGSPDSLVGRLYRQLRRKNNYDNPSLMLKLLGRDIKRQLYSNEKPLLVAHPILVAILKGRKNVFYQHGEVIAPDESIAFVADYVFVPTEEVASRFIAKGCRKDQVIVTGLCIEPALVVQNEDAFKKRQMRLNSNEPLTGAFFSSGAEPEIHLKRLVMMATSAAKANYRIIIFAKAGGKFEQAIMHIFSPDENIITIDSSEAIPYDLPKVMIVKYRNRREENIFTARLFSSFDYFVAPSHERTNWALGLGLPMFIVDPPIGPFAPLNRSILINHAVGYPVESIEKAAEFGQLVDNLRQSSTLNKMLENGYHKYEIDGFEKITDFFNNKYAENSL